MSPIKYDRRKGLGRGLIVYYCSRRGVEFRVVTTGCRELNEVGSKFTLWVDVHVDEDIEAHLQSSKEISRFGTWDAPPIKLNMITKRKYVEDFMGYVCDEVERFRAKS